MKSLLKKVKLTGTTNKWARGEQEGINVREWFYDGSDYFTY
jgi:hypothetical protein